MMGSGDGGLLDDFPSQLQFTDRFEKIPFKQRESLAYFIGVNRGDFAKYTFHGSPNSFADCRESCK